jgi:electron transfer flavoprotein beta subunit
MKLIALVKATPETEDITVAADGSLDLSRAASKPGAYDLVAIEVARQLADQTGGQVTALTVDTGAMANAKLRKDVLSRGADQLITVPVDLDLDTHQTAAAIAQALGQVEFDLVVAGAGSADVYAQQVGNVLGALLDRPTLNAVSKMTLEGTSLVVERELENQVQVLEVPLPAVVSVTSAMATPRIPGMKDILAAGKKPTTEVPVTPPEPTVKQLALVAPTTTQRAMTVIEGEVADVAAQLAAYLNQI